MVDGKSFKNYDDYPASGIGTITLREAVANSCNTAFISSRDRLQDGDLADAAAALGLGVDHDLGFPAYFGQVPPPDGRDRGGGRPDRPGQGARLPDGDGDGRRLGGGRPRPCCPSSCRTPARGRAGGAADRRRRRRSCAALMRAVVTEGPGSFLADLPGEVGAKTGTAEYGAPDASGSLPTHTWMIATQGDLAVAVFVETGESGSRTAGPILERFLS